MRVDIHLLAAFALLAGEFCAEGTGGERLHALLLHQDEPGMEIWLPGNPDPAP